MAATQEEIDDLRELVAEYTAALKAVLRNQSYEMPDGRKLTRASLKDIQEGRRVAQGELAKAEGLSTGRVRRGVVVQR